jgi:hypothetical protein
MSSFSRRKLGIGAIDDRGNTLRGRAIHGGWRIHEDSKRENKENLRTKGKITGILTRRHTTVTGRRAAQAVGATF